MMIKDVLERKRVLSEIHPESLMMSYGYSPESCQGAVKCPIFQTSTFVFRSAEEGKRFFELAYQLRAPEPGEEAGLIYSRLNNSDLDILEKRLTLWDGAEASAVFESGMAAITTLLLTFLRPGNVVLHSDPLYGGTEFLLDRVLPEFGIHAVGFPAGAGLTEVGELVESLETLKMRMTAQMQNARYVADFLADHPKVEKVHYLGHLTEKDPQFEIFESQCWAPGAMISFDVKGGEEEAFRVLNALGLVQLAVSLGGTESLAEHPASMPHADLPPAVRERMGIGPGMIRLSVGVEHPDDLIQDLAQALEAV